MSDNIFDKRNDLIYFDKDIDKPALTKQALPFKPVKDLYSRDRSQGKKFINKCVKMVYYLHHKDSPIAHLSTEMKRNEIGNMSDDLNTFDFGNEYYKAFEKFFIETHHSRIEQRYLRFISDLDDIRDSLIEMPTKVRQRVSKLIGEGENQHKLEGVVEYDNQIDKVRSIRSLLDLDKLESVLKAKVEEEYKAKKSNNRRLFDQ